MAILKVPRITTLSRSNLVLEKAEIVMDTDQNIYYGGDGETLGGFPLGGGLFSSTETVLITQEMVNNKRLNLEKDPLFSSKVTLDFIGGIPQLNGTDFEIILGNVLSWEGKGLDNFIEKDDLIIITY
jgi:hypothetical protein